MAGEDEREALSQVADLLCEEFGYTPDRAAAEYSPPSALTSGQLFTGSLDEEDERLIAAAREALTRIAGALRAKKPAGVPETAVPILLDGAEMVMRRELALGNRPSTLMSGFVFLVTLPLVDQDEALELASRTASLLEAT